MDIDRSGEERAVMAEESQDNSDNFRQAEKTGEDLTGRDRLVSNVLFSWGTHFVFIIAGFIMPRMVDRRLGQELLGVWDFAWSLVSYFGWVQMGLNTSVNRYVARYRTLGDISGVNRVVSSASCLLGIIGLLVLGLTIVLSLLLPQLFGARLGENVRDTQWVVFFLGAGLAIQISLGAFSGVLTGCYRYKLVHIIGSGWHTLTTAGMILALLKGGSLPSLAVITFAGLVLTYSTKVVLAYRVFKDLRVRPSLIGWETIRKLFVFGGKRQIPAISRLLLNQTTSILIVAYLGPMALALYSRPRSLIRHVDALVNKMAMTLAPTTSSLQSTNDLEGIRMLLIKSVRYTFYLVLPLVLVLTVFGSPILHLWMGPRYANGLVPAILAVGYLATMVQVPALRILMGMNAHGRAGLAQFVASLCSVGLTVLVLGYLEWGLAGAAVAVTLPLTVMNVVCIPWLICRRVNLDVREYFLSTMVGPMVHILPFAICLVCARLVFRNQLLAGLIWGGAAGSAILAVLYWQYVLPAQMKKRVVLGLKACGCWILPVDGGT